MSSTLTSRVSPEAAKALFAFDIQLLRELRPLQRFALTLFVHRRVVTTAELARHLDLSLRQATKLCTQWIDDEFLEFENASRKARAYRLADPFEDALAEASGFTSDLMCQSSPKILGTFPTFPGYS